MKETMSPITVAGLIAYLQGLPQDLPVAYQCYSEECLLQKEDISIKERQAARPDGWVHGWRPDKPAIKYLVFPGN